MDARDVQLLKSHGLSDAQITVAVQVIGYFNYINRVADGLEVQLEEWMLERSKEDWLATKASFNE